MWGEGGLGGDGGEVMHYECSSKERWSLYECAYDMWHNVTHNDYFPTKLPQRYTKI